MSVLLPFEKSPSNPPATPHIPINAAAAKNAASDALAPLVRVRALPRYEIESPLRLNHRVGALGQFKLLRHGALDQSP